MKNRLQTDILIIY